MSEIVTLHHNEPMTTSLAIADGVEMDHASVLKLIRNHVERLAKFGGVGFEIQPFETNGGKQWRDVYFLNEQQSTFLVTLMRNTPIVLDFKEALVRAFFEMRDQLRLTAPANPPFLTSNLSHGADLAVAADRTFRGFLRSAKSSGLSWPQALRTANRQTIARTGMDMLHELGMDIEEIQRKSDPATPKLETDPLFDALSDWAANAASGTYYSLRTIIHEATGMDTETPEGYRLVGKSGPYLRSLGFKHRKMRLGGAPVNLWTKL